MLVNLLGHLKLLEPFVPAVTPIDPLTLTGNIVYLNSTTPTLAEGVALTTWLDISGNGRNAGQAVGGQKPVGRTSTNLSPNGTQLVEFNGHSKEMTGSLPGIPIDNSLGFTWYTAFRLVTLESDHFFGQYVFGTPFAGYTEIFARGSDGFGYTNDTQIGMGSNQAGAFHYSSGVALASGWQTLVLRQSPPAGALGAAQLYRNGLAIGAAKAWNTGPVTGYNLGGTSGNAGLLGGIGVALLRAGADDDDTMAGILAYIARVFGSPA
jgi:hypothetical protein